MGVGVGVGMRRKYCLNSIVIYTSLLISCSLSNPLIEKLLSGYSWQAIEPYWLEEQEFNRLEFFQKDSSVSIEFYNENTLIDFGHIPNLQPLLFHCQHDDVYEIRLDSNEETNWILTITKMSNGQKMYFLQT